MVDRLIDYKALVRRCRHDDLPATIAAALADRDAASVVVPAGLDGTWLALISSTIRIDGSAPDDQLSVAEVDGTDGVITALRRGGGRNRHVDPGRLRRMGRRMITLIPDYHLCIVLPDQICADVPQALRRLDPTRPLTMISGPSATSDIELNRVEGVHGPEPSR